MARELCLQDKDRGTIIIDSSVAYNPYYIHNYQLQGLSGSNHESGKCFEDGIERFFVLLLKNIIHRLIRLYKNEEILFTYLPHIIIAFHWLRQKEFKYKLQKQSGAIAEKRIHKTTARNSKTCRMAKVAIRGSGSRSYRKS